jgi:hypothetical protein
MAVKATTPAIMHRQDRRSGLQQMDLFRAGVADGTNGAPKWTELPEDARDALVSLMTQLILKHARTSRAPSEAAEAVHDC